ncbi:MAG TPA: MBG domain-containing protein [Thermoanaerobaculia bacterium]|nr:MBG domain-containing protein [Thermoanaerobaculia bacterium]
MSFVAAPLLAQSSYSTGFETPTFSVAEVNGQDGWGRLDNSPTTGFVEASPAGTPAALLSQSLAIRTRKADFIGVANNLFSPVISPAAGETGSTAVVAVPNPKSRFVASFWYRTPDVAPTSVISDGRFAELDPSSKGPGADDGANRYAVIRLSNITDPITSVVSPRVDIRSQYSGGFVNNTVATLAWGTWYRFDIVVDLVDGLNGAEPNDRVRVDIYSAAGVLIGSACGTTWEVGYKSGSFGGGTTPRAINGFDFWSYATPNGSLVGYIDDFSMTATDSPAALQASITGSNNVCSGGTTTLTASATGGSGSIVTYVWRDAANTVVGNAATFDAPSGTYTVTITDSDCATSSSASFTVTDLPQLAASITGTLSVCYGDTTTLTANASGGSGTISGYTWRDADANIVGTASTLVAGEGTYTVTITDAQCGSVVSAPATVQTTCKATPTVTWSDPADITYGTPLSGTQLNATASVPGTFTYAPAAGTVLNAGANQALSVDFAPADSAHYNDVNGTVVHINVLQATPTVTVSGGPFAYDGSSHAATAVARDASNNVVPGSFAITYDGSATAPTNAGSYAVVATFTSSDPNFTDAVGNGTLVIDPATPTVTVTGGTFTYDGSSHSATAVARDASNNVVPGSFTFTYNGSATPPSNAGSYAVVASFSSSDPNFSDATGNGTITINAATPTVTVTGGTFTYDGSSHSATAVARDASNNVVSGSFTFTYNGSATPPSNAGTYAVVATFTSSDPNFSDASGNGSITINPATPTVTVTGGTFTYDGSSHSATAVARDASNNVVPGSFTFTYNGSSTPPSNAGTYAVVASFTSSDPNFTNATGNGSININPATPTVTVTGGTFTYDGSSHAATAVAREASNNVVPGSFTFTYNGSATPPSNAGSYAVVATFTSSDPNFSDTTGNGSITINPGTPTVTVTGGTFTYDGSSHSATAVARDASNNVVPGSFTFTYNGSSTPPSNAGTYAVVASFTSSDPNFTNATDNGGITISPATPIVTVTGGTFTYDGSSHSATAVARDASSNVVPGSFAFTYNGSATPPTNPGSYAVVASFTSSDPNFTNATGNGSITINPSSAETPTVTVTGGTYTYDGAPHAATAVARDSSNNDVPGTFTMTYDGSAVAPTNAGTYAVVADFTSSDPNFTNATGNGSLTINPATPTITVTGGTFTYDGTPHSATAVARDARNNVVVGSFTFTYNGSSTPPSSAGTYAVVATFTSSDPNFTNATGNGSITISPATPALTVTGGTFTYDGTPHSATAVARDANNNIVAGSFTITYDGSATAPANAGTYAVVANFTSSDPNFTNATGNGSLTITSATPTVTVTGGIYAYDGAPHSATAVARDANNNIVAGSFTFTYDGSATPPTNPGTYVVVATFTSSDPNFTNATGNGSLTINAAGTQTPTVTVTGGTFTYDGTPHAATAVARDASNNDVAGTFTFTYDGNATAPTNAGTYAVVANFTSSDPNFTNATGNGSLTINPATPTVTVTGGPFTYDGTPHAATAVARDASNNVVAGSFTFTYDGGATAPTNAGTYAVVAKFTSSDPNFTNATGNGSLTIDRATPVVSWSNPPTITYGTLLGATQLNATASVAGTFTYTPPAGTRLTAGTHTLSVAFDPTDATNYNSVPATTVQIDVDKAPTTIVIDSISPTPSMAGASVTVTFTLSGIIGTPSGSVFITDGTTSCTASPLAHSCTMAFAAAGTHTLTATFSGDSNHLGSTSPDFMHQVIEGTGATAFVDGSNSICAGSSTMVRAILTGTAPWTLTWSDGFVETTSEDVHLRTVTPSSTTIYTITALADAEGPGTAAGSATITVNIVAPPVIASVSSVELGQPVTLHATSGYMSYQWLHDGTPIDGATSDSLTIASVAPSDLGSYSVRATRNGCTSAASLSYSVVLPGTPLDFDAVIPVVGNVPGAGGSLFRTTVHLTNATDTIEEGEITFVDATLPAVHFQLAPHETRFLDDLLPAAYHSLTSANVRRLRGPLPSILAHVFNDQAEHGTSGLLERAIPIERTLTAGDRAVLVTPIDPIAARMNIGLRSFADGLLVRITRRAADGTLLGTTDHAVAPSTLEQQPASALVAAPIGISESLTFEVLNGGGVIYGSATDNGTNDPNMQMAAELGAAPRSGRYVLAVAGSTAGQFNSHFSTGLQIHNPAATAMTAMLTFHPQGSSGSAFDPHRAITIEPHATAAMDDVVASIAAGINGLGSLDVATDAATAPVLLARVYSIAAEGESSLTTPLVAEEDVLAAGEEGVLAAPHALAAHRFNIGVRTLGSGARITATVRNQSGAVLRVVPLSFAPSYFGQSSAASLLGIALTGDESIVFAIDEGSAIVYGTWTDNITQDLALQYAVRPLTGQ